MRPHGSECRANRGRDLSRGLQVEVSQQSGRASGGDSGSRRQFGQTGPAGLEKYTVAFATVMIARLMLVLRHGAVAVAVGRVLALMIVRGHKRNGGTAIKCVLVMRATTDAHMRRQQDGRDNRDEFAIQHNPSFTRVPFKYRPHEAEGQVKLCRLA
jgi:hypothetical protein